MSAAIKHDYDLDSISFTDDSDFGQYAIVRNVFSIAGMSVPCITTYAIQEGGDLCGSFRLNVALVHELFVTHGVLDAEAQEVASAVVEMNAHYVASYTMPDIYGE